MSPKGWSFYKTIAIRYASFMGKMIDTAAAAEKLGVNLQRIRALLQERRIPGARLIGRQWFVPEDFKVTPGTRGPELRKPRHGPK